MKPKRWTGSRTRATAAPPPPAADAPRPDVGGDRRPHWAALAPKLVRFVSPRRIRQVTAAPGPISAVDHRPPAGAAPLYRPLRLVLAPPLRLLYRVRVDGIEHLPAEGPALIAPNHRSFIDSLFVALVVPRRVTFLAKAEYFERRRTRWFFRGTGQIPLRRGNAAAAQRALALAAARLDQGEVVVVYPEGTRSRDGRLRRGHTGPARLAVETGAPLIPVGLVGTEAVQPVGRLVPRPFRRVGVRFGAPLTSLAGRDCDRQTLRAVTDDLMAAIGRLSGQERAGCRQARAGVSLAPVSGRA